MKKDKVVVKSYYTIKVEILAPVEVIYRVYAENEDEALEMIEKSPPVNNLVRSPKIFWGRMKRRIAKVYKSGLLNILKQKNY